MKIDYRPHLAHFFFVAVVAAFCWLLSFRPALFAQSLHGCKDLHAQANRHFAYCPVDTSSADYRTAGAAICAGEQTCLVSFWNDPHSVPTSLPMSNAQLNDRKAVWLNRSCDLFFCNCGECGG